MQQLLLRGAAGSTQGLALSQCQLDISKLHFEMTRQCRIEIVTTEQEVLADGGSLEFQLATHAARAHQAEVARTAADVAYQDQIAGTEVVIGAFGVGVGEQGWAVGRRMRL